MLGGAALIMLRILSGGRPRLWILLGVVLGIGIENKIAVLWLEGGLAVGLLVTPERRLLATRGPWLAALISLALAAPYAVWQLGHNFATLHFMHDVVENRVAIGPIAFLAWVADGMLMLAAPVWIAGLVFFLILPAGRGRRAMGWAWLAIMALLTFSHAAKAYYAAAAFSWLLAAGGVAIERWMRAAAAHRPRRLHRPDCPERADGRPDRDAHPARAGRRRGFAAKRRRAPGGIEAPCREASGFSRDDGRMGRDRRQSRRRIQGVATCRSLEYHGDRVVYQLAAAIDILGPARGLPPASSGHNNYWFWGFHGSWDDPLVVIGYPEQELHRWFRDITPMGHTRCRVLQLS